MRGYHVIYRPGEMNRCPGCSRSHWQVGRLLAECGFCGTAVPIDGARFSAAPRPRELAA